MEHLLSSGMILDGRYRIDHMLGEGGFGITYAAENMRIGLKVAIKEFFWRDHSTRNIDESPCVSFLHAGDKDSFQILKERFLKEARILRDFSSLSGIVHIFDYFEENDTAYIVMEYVEGVTLSQYLSEHGGQMETESLLRRVLPVVDSLDQIHKSSVIHRDISPDNIMVTPDGTLKIIDFGAARQVVLDDTRYTAITKGCYTPCEQYDANGYQGPWTDVYALCATLYACICSSPPQGAIQRMFLDELKAPSQLGIAISPAYEAIIMNGLQLRPEKRWQSMDELAKAIRAALPEERPPSANRRGLVIGLLAGLLCIAVAVGFWGWRRYDATHKFRGIETERIRFEATEDTTAAEFAAAPTELRRRLEDFVGKDNYLLDVDGDSMMLTLPLSVFENREIVDVIQEHFSKLVPEKGTNIRYERKANWEDPAQSLIVGKNQVLPEALGGPTVQCVFSWSNQLTPGKRANLIVDIKTRIDALDTPYAFGTAYGNDDIIIFRIDLEHAGALLKGTLGSKQPLYLGNEWGISFRSIDSNYTMEPVVNENGAMSLKIAADEAEQIKALEVFSRDSLEKGFEKISLIDENNHVIAWTRITEPITDGILVFSDFFLKDISTIDENNRWLIDYLIALLQQTELPDIGNISWDWDYIDAKGQMQFEDEELQFGLNYASMPDYASDWRNRLTGLQQELSFTMKEDEQNITIYLNLPSDDTLPDCIMETLPELIEKLDIDHKLLPKSLHICFEDQDKNENRILSIFSNYQYYDNSSKRYRTWFLLTCTGAAIQPYYDTLNEWCNNYDWNSAGIDSYLAFIQNLLPDLFTPQ